MSYKRYTKQEIEYIYDNYVNKNKSTTTIAKEIERSQTGVEQCLKRMGVDVKSYSTKMKLAIPESEHYKVCQLYLQNYTTIEIANMYNVTDRTIANILRKNNIKIREAIIRSIIKHHDIFNNIDTPEKAYWIGWLLTDGCVQINNNKYRHSGTISLALQAQDKYIVENFAEFVGASKDKVKLDNKVHQTAYFRFTSNIMIDDLAKYHITPNKTGKQELPKFTDELMPYLLRGIFEGNGSVYISNNRLRTAFYGGYEMIADIVKLLNEKNIYTPHAVVNRGVISSYHISAIEASYKLFQYMYGDITNDKIICKRKYNKFISYYKDKF